MALLGRRKEFGREKGLQSTDSGAAFRGSGAYLGSTLSKRRNVGSGKAKRRKTFILEGGKYIFHGETNSPFSKKRR